MYLSKKDISEWIASLKVGDEVTIQITRMDGVIVSSERGIVDKWLGKRLIIRYPSRGNQMQLLPDFLLDCFGYVDGKRDVLFILGNIQKRLVQ